VNSHDIFVNQHSNGLFYVRANGLFGGSLFAWQHSFDEAVMFAIAARKALFGTRLVIECDVPERMSPSVYAAVMEVDQDA